MTSLDGPFFRIYREIHKTPMFFGKTLNYRFDSASGECGVLYAAPVLAGAFVETFMQELGRTSVSLKELRDRPVALIRPKRPLRFIDLCAPGGQMRLGLDGRICTGSMPWHKHGRMRCGNIRRNPTAFSSPPDMS